MDSLNPRASFTFHLFLLNMLFLPDLLALHPSFSEPPDVCPLDQVLQEYPCSTIPQLLLALILSSAWELESGCSGTSCLSCMISHGLHFALSSWAKLCADPEKKYKGRELCAWSSLHVHTAGLHLHPLEPRTFQCSQKASEKRHPEFNWPDTLLQGKLVNLSQRAGVHLFNCISKKRCVNK